MIYSYRIPKLLILAFIALSLLFSCNYDNENEIRDYIKSCAGDLIKQQLDSSVRKKDYYFEDQKFTMFIDSTGKPTFFESEQQTSTIILNIDENRYIVELDGGIISVDEN